MDAAVRPLSRATAAVDAVSDGMVTPSAHTVYGAVYGTAADMTVEEDVYRAAEEAYDRFGSLDCWINNVGSQFSKKGEEYGEQDIEQNHKVCFFSTIYGHPGQHSAI